MNQDIVNHEITESVKCDSESNEKQIIHTALHAKVEKNDAGKGKNHKENIISFENICIFWLVMIGMKIPHQTVHNVLMRKPGHTFHEKENTQKD
jgi:hypothetical protein